MFCNLGFKFENSVSGSSKNQIHSMKGINQRYNKKLQCAFGTHFLTSERH